MGEQVFSNENTGVIVVDVQADFTELKSGTLAVPGTDVQYLEAVETATRQILQQGLPVYFTQDWHPADHVSFFTNNPGTEPLQVIEVDRRPQVMWPPHCVQNTSGAEILVAAPGPTKRVRKGMDPKFDSYSGFADDGGRKTEMDNLLRQDGIKNLIIYGLATDYCVKATAIDAVDAGYKVTVIEGLSKGVAPETTAQALEDMKAKGIIVKADLDV
ncbi:Nicotinamidase (EC [Olavius sp. associated proteobacterium Delta 1]|nr:Nicotinamidase (EC [Olavius sp. associated proteobacterium Delta 1]